jgi:hypothetical protein
MELTLGFIYGNEHEIGVTLPKVFREILAIPLLSLARNQLEIK